MLIPNLSVLLSERRLTLTKVSQDTGISRTTLTALTGRSARGVQFDTLNTLCQYLKVTPDALFIYRPFDLSMEWDGGPGPGTVRFTLRRAGTEALCCALPCEARAHYAPGEAGQLTRLTLRLGLPGGPERDDALRLTALLRELPPTVLSDIELDLLSRFDRRLDPAPNPDADYIPEVRWPWEEI